MNHNVHHLGDNFDEKRKAVMDRKLSQNQARNEKLQNLMERNHSNAELKRSHNLEEMKNKLKAHNEKVMEKVTFIHSREEKDQQSRKERIQ